MQLNKREAEILRLVSEGNSYKQVARVVDLSLPTIKFYIRSAKDKLAAKNVCQAVALFVRIYVL
jgi:DNA-binding CsgD family transcriptional regulator